LTFLFKDNEVGINEYALTVHVVYRADGEGNNWQPTCPILPRLRKRSQYDLVNVAASRGRFKGLFFIL